MPNRFDFKETTYYFIDEHFYKDKDDKPLAALVAGFYVPESNLKALEDDFQSFKRKYFKNDIPIKWSPDATLIGKINQSLINGKSFDCFKKDLINHISNKYTNKIRIIAAFSFYSNNQTEAWKESLSWILQRIGMDLDNNKNEIKTPSAIVISDWLPGTTPQTKEKLEDFLSVYSTPYINGYKKQETKFIKDIPPLHDSLAFESLLVSSWRTSPLLQLCDCFVGAMSQLFDNAFFHKNHDLNTFFVPLFPLLRCESSSPLGEGLIVGENDKKKIETELRNLGLG